MDTSNITHTHHTRSLWIENDASNKIEQQNGYLVATDRDDIIDLENDIHDLENNTIVHENSENDDKKELLNQTCFNKNLIKKLISANLIKIGDFTLKNGKHSDIYFDFKGLTNHPQLVVEISYELSKFVVINDDEAIVGIPYGGIPYAVNIAQIKNLPLTLIRNEKKQYGMKNLIEGEVKTTITLIEDVITSGQSVSDMIKLIEDNGSSIKRIICILDREDGGFDMLKNKGYIVHSLFKLSNFREHTSNLREVNMGEVDMGNINTNNINAITKTLINIVQTKKTNLVVSLDMESSDEILNMIRLIGDHVCAIKLHLDIIKNKSKQFAQDLLLLKQNMKFLIIEDRKFADIAHISVKQFNNLESFIDIITVHGICGESLIAELNKLNVGMLLIHQLSVSNNLIDTLYSCRVKDMALSYHNVIGFISQDRISSDHSMSNYLTFTPGVNLDQKSDGKGQKYRNIDECDSDIYIVGRGICDSDDVENTVNQYKLTAFKNWKYTEFKL